MSVFESNSRHLREVLIFCFHLKKTAAGAHRMLSATQEELAKSLEVTQEAISKRLKAMGIIQKQGNWVSYELKPRDVERRFFACEQLLQTELEGVFASHCDRR